MTLADIFSKMTLSQKDAEVIFDPDEPVGKPTDVVMPRRRWFRRKNSGDKSTTRSTQPISAKS